MGKASRRKAVQHSRRQDQMHTSGVTPKYMGVPSNLPEDIEVVEVGFPRELLDKVFALTADDAKKWLLQFFVGSGDMVDGLMKVWPKGEDVPDELVEHVDRVFKMKLAFLQALGYSNPEELM
jgi:hypothetical protein